MNPCQYSLTHPSKSCTYWTGFYNFDSMFQEGFFTMQRGRNPFIIGIRPCGQSEDPTRRTRHNGI